jgi:HK97 family phage prohead protease
VKPIAWTEAGSLSLRDVDDALHIEARVSPATSWANDVLASLGLGLTKGLSPGFRVPPGGDTVTRSGDDLLRTVQQADLFEVSLVTRPAYSAAQIAARSWALADNSSGWEELSSALRRWRA